MNQYLFDLSDPQVSEIIETIGRERLTKYFASTRSDKEALHLYQINGRLAKHIHDMIGGFEIALRNRISESIIKHHGREDWYKCRSFLMQLNKERRQNILEVRKRLKYESRKENTGRIIAGLTLHFWVSMHESKYRDNVWTPHLHKIWPKGENLKKVHKDLLKTRDLRNRIAHHEPIFRDEWHDRADRIWTRFEQIAPVKAAWYKSRLKTKIDELKDECRIIIHQE